MKTQLLNEHLNSIIPKLHTTDRSLLSTKNRLKLNNGSIILAIKLNISSVVPNQKKLTIVIIIITVIL